MWADGSEEMQSLALTPARGPQRVIQKPEGSLGPFWVPGGQTIFVAV